MRTPRTGASPILRLATPADGAEVAAVYAPYVLDTAISFELRPPDGEEMAGRIARTLERTPWVVAEVEGVVRAYAYAGRFRERQAYDWTAESTVYVDRAWQGAGLGRAAMRAVLAILRLQGFRLVVAGITPPNPASLALHRSLGFLPVGGFDGVGWKDGAWRGVDFLALELGERRDGVAPAPIRPLPELLRTPGLAAALAGGP
jgi:L-amino acid N-acyltransferase YncA